MTLLISIVLDYSNTSYRIYTAHAVRKYIIITQSSTSISILTAVQNYFIKNKQHHNHTVRVGLGKDIYPEIISIRVLTRPVFIQLDASEFKFIF